jgi:hypothetical protein
MIKITIEVDSDITEMIAKDIAGKQQELLIKAAHAVRNEWQAALTDKYASYGLERPQPGFARGLRIRPQGSNMYVVWCDNPYALWMKYQENDFDYKTTHPYGNKSRVSKDGTPYLIVPFRRFTPNAGREYQRMTKNDEKRARNLSLTETTKGSYHEANARGESIERSIKNWGQRLKNAETANDEGMIAVHGTGNRREYYTFRVISAKSPQNRWIRKARPTILDQLEKNISLEDII